MSGHFDGTLGALLLGHLIAMLLFGITSLQSWVYLRRNYQDCIVLRSLVLFLWLIDCLHVALATHGVYFYFVTNFGDVAVTLKPSWSLIMIPMVSAVSNLVVRALFAYRLWALSGKSILIHMVAGAMSFYVVGLAIFISVEGLFVTSWSALRQYKWSIYAGLISEVTVNLIIMVAQYLFLRHLRSGIRLKSTDTFLHTLIIYSINTGLVTSIASVMAVVVFAALPNTLLYVAFYLVTSKLYLNALLANLNARDSLRECLHQDKDGCGGQITVLGTGMAFERPS
ncbi:hypothetical protein OBBRIDRAFT_791781 [Obba rivulosa]|uniref:DUF6534 domain-containing protein n=1 Tax=Obba rivulosa TaxID=1052685 RepID=A0A8E2B504_9APHY|nr:hypothetical protein OBBRIDRAFT_791781 [Obba rivulosa]